LNALRFCFQIDRKRGSIKPTLHSLELLLYFALRTPHFAVFAPAGLPYLWMLLGAMAFAAMGGFAHGLSDDCDWRVIATARTFLAMIFALGLALSARVTLVVLRPPTMWIRSIAGSISLLCTFYSLTRLPIGDVLALTNMFPLWIAILSWPVLGVRPTVSTWLAIVSGICGLWLIQQPHFAQQNFASVVAIVSSFSSAIAMLGLHRLHGLDPRAIVVHFSAVSLAFCLAAFWIFPPTTGDASLAYHTFPLATLGQLLGVGIAATTGQLFLTKAFAAGPPARVSVIGLTQVVWGMLLDMLIWNRKIELMTVVGMLLILGPTAWLLLRRKPPPELAEEVFVDE